MADKCLDPGRLPAAPHNQRQGHCLRREFPDDSEGVRAAAGGYAVDIAAAVDDEPALRALSVVGASEIMKVGKGPAGTVRTELKEHTEGVPARSGSGAIEISGRVHHQRAAWPTSTHGTEKTVVEHGIGITAAAGRKFEDRSAAVRASCCCRAVEIAC